VVPRSMPMILPIFPNLLTFDPVWAPALVQH
jgi:hypothetical protein